MYTCIDSQNQIPLLFKKFSNSKHFGLEREPVPVEHGIRLLAEETQ
jgi:hypothetical protein